MILKESLNKFSAWALQIADGTPDISFTDFCHRTLNFQLHSWQKIVTERLGRLKDETGARIVIHGPPQYGKSIITSQRLPAYLLGTNPKRRVGLACYNITHASGFGDVVVNLMQSEQFKEMFPLADMPRIASRDAFTLPARKALRDGTYSWVAMGLQTGFVGKGFGPGDCLIVDDPYQSPDAAISENINETTWRWWGQTAKVRIDPLANVVVFFHRYHEDDFAGRLLAEGNWEYYRFPAIADGPDGDPTGREEGELLSPMRTREYLLELSDKDPQTFLGQFQGRPRPPEGAFIQRPWLKEEQNPPRFKRVCRFWDLAAESKQRNDFTAGALVGIDDSQTVWVLDVARFRAEWPDACATIAKITEDDFKKYRQIGTEYCVGVEKVAWQTPMIQDLFRLGIYQSVQLWPVRPDRDKKTRASGWTARAAHDKLRILRNVVWNQDFINECVAFDGLGLTHDDQIDGVSGAYSLLWQLSGEVKIEKEPVKYSKEWYDEIDRTGKLPDEYLDGESDGEDDAEY